MQWSADAQPSSTASCTPGPRPSWLACSRSPSPAARPASSTARHWSASNAPRSQKASIHRACGAHSASMSPQTSPTYSSARPSYSGGTTWAPRKRRLGGELAGDPEQPGLVGDGAAVAGLDLDRRDPGAASFVEAGVGESGKLGVTRPPGRRDRDVDAAGLVRRAGHPGGELGGPVAGEHEVGVTVDEPGDHAPPGGVDARIGRRRRAGADRRDAVAVDHDVGVGQLALDRVGDEQPDAVDGDRAHASAASSSRGTSTET